LSEQHTDYFPERERSNYFPHAEVIPRDIFLKEFKEDYQPGQHLTSIGPTQRGKSRLNKELLKRVISPDLKLIALVGKPPHRERTWNDDAADELNLHITETWPPSLPGKVTNLFNGKGREKNNNGWLVRPVHTMTDLVADDDNMRRHFRAAILHAYGSVKEQFITLVDEAHHVQVDLGLKHEIDAPLMRGAPDNGVWQSLQRGRFVTYQTYCAPEHVLVFKDNNRDNQQRYSEIGGVDAQYMTHLVKNLRTERVPSGGTISQAVYFRRASDDVRIVDT
jgi:hypothetical protein